MIYNPWHCLFFEAMESVTSSLSFTAAVTYAAKLSTTNTDSSVQGLIGGLYYGVGKKIIYLKFIYNKLYFSRKKCKLLQRSRDILDKWQLFCQQLVLAIKLKLQQRQRLLI